MKLTLKRIALRDTYTIGRLFINGKYECDTIEDKVRDLNHNGKFDNGEVKVKGETAIPYGEYTITMKVKSPRFAEKIQYKKCGGYLPRLQGVPNFEGVLIHIGNTAADSEGCILVGKNTAKGRVTESTTTFWALYNKLLSAEVKGETITIEII